MKTKLLFLILFMPLMALAADGDAVAVPADPAQAFNWLNLIVTAVTPIVIAAIKWGVPKIPGWMLPIAAPFVGLGVDWALRTAGVQTDGGIQAALLGAAGVWLREAQDQMRKAVPSSTPTVPTK